MRRKGLVGLFAVLFCLAGVAVAETFTYTGAGADALWSTCGNWTAVVPAPDPCYPAETIDDIRIDGDAQPADMVFLEVDCPPPPGNEICIIVDDLTIEGAFTIDNAQSTVSRLWMDSLRVLGGTNGATLTLKNIALLEGIVP